MVKRQMTAGKAPQGYLLQVRYLKGQKKLTSFLWPVPLQQTPRYLEQYIKKHELDNDMALSLKLWFYSGYSIRENGFFLGPEFGSELNYIDAYRYAQTGDFSGITPIDYYMISVRRRTIPGALKQSVPAIRMFLKKAGASTFEAASVWKWAYEGHSIYSSPGGRQLDYLTWFRQETSKQKPCEAEYPWDLFDDWDPDDDQDPDGDWDPNGELPF